MTIVNIKFTLGRKSLLMRYIIQLFAVCFSVLCMLNSHQLTAGRIMGTEASIPFAMHSGLMVVEVVVDGLRGNYIFDTGCAEIILNQKPTTGLYQFATVEAEQKADILRIKHLQIADLAIAEVDVYALDLDPLVGAMSIKIDGILGWSYFSEGSLSIDFKNNVIHYSLNDRGIKVDMDRKYRMVSLPVEVLSDESLIVSAEVDGKPIRCILDTGANVNALYLSNQYEPYASKDIKLGSVTIQNSPVKSLDIRQYLDKQYHKKDIRGILSVSALNADYMIVDLKRNRILIFWQQARA